MKKIILISILALLLAGCKKQEPNHYRVVSARYIVKEHADEYIEVIAENKEDCIKIRYRTDAIEIGKRNEVIEDLGGIDIYLTAENYKKVLKEGLIEIEEE